MKGFCVVVAVLLAGTGVARAGHATIVVMSDPTRAGELGSALQVALSGRGVAIASVAPPDGALRLDRAASAQHAAVELDADAALWIDVGSQDVELCAVTADGRVFRHAPLASGSPRAFASTAISLLDELVDAPEAGFAPPGVEVAVSGAPGADVRVDVDVGPSSVREVPDTGEPVRANRMLFEIGPMLSPVTVGIETELMFPLSPRIRFGLQTSVGSVLTNKGSMILTSELEVRHVGLGQHHWDFGGLVGAASVENDGIFFAGARISRVWEHASRGTSLSLAPVLATNGETVIPGVYASLRWELPL